MSQVNVVLGITPRSVGDRAAHHVPISVKHCDTKLAQIRHNILGFSL
jgi:hypothetical protein